MGRKRREGSAAAALLGCCLLLLHGYANGYGEVGCLFSKNLCKLGTETCYNDLAFGRCIQLNDDELSETDLYQYNLEPEELELLRMQLERLEYEGYKWPHDYTQCVMQILLDDLRYRMNNDIEFLCSNLKQTDFNEENQIVNKDGNALDVDSEAIVKYTPKKMSPRGSVYADEFYYPERLKSAAAARFDDYDESLYDKLASIGNPDEVYRRGSRSLPKKATASADPYLGDNNYALPREYVEALRGILDGKQSNKYEIQDEDELEFLPSGDGKKSPIDIAQYEKSFSRKYKYPSQLESVDFIDRTGDVDDDDDDDYKDNNFNDDDGDGDDNDGMRPIVESLAAQQTAIYPEGGTIMPMRRDVAMPDEYDDIPVDDDLEGMLWRRELAGFKRRERLDVKKPGPQFATNNYAFKTQSTEAPEDQIQEVEDKDNDVVYVAQVKKDISTSILSSTPKTNVEPDRVYIQFDQEIATWPDGKRIVNIVENLVGLQQNELRDIDVGEATITFRVAENSKNYNASDVVHKIGDERDSLQKQLNVEVIRYGIGKDLPTMLEVSQNSEMSSSLFGALVAAGVAGVTAAAIVVLIIARRHAKSRAKLAGLRTPDPEASKDYQELCRARMAAKQTDKVSESPKGFDFGRLIESGKSESNRSSTSSWGDEPQATHMDVATGHVVLSYMEEHLKNQEKLDEEWAALCAYEAEPCSTAIAEAEGNAECNRPGAALPYDHSRVILNDLTNLNNSDYINASTITDHDPRNPAYIATQGPLPQTTADFWQLVWEQGSVVIVMLTRLTEEGQSMCHRYWPEEGSELYHIYEVHLVSEHVWCNEYLVRSFYLKNLRSGETRTVTQFHYLDWPHNQVPKSTKTLLEFRRKVNKSYRGRSCPIIVHCSDGAGRTGTYCLIDMVLNRMSKGAKEIDIAATLEHIRDQRPNMVADKQQFEFSLMAVAEEVHTILKSLPIVAEKTTNGDKQEQQQQQSTTKSDK